MITAATLAAVLAFPQILTTPQRTIEYNAGFEVSAVSFWVTDDPELIGVCTTPISGPGVTKCDNPDLACVPYPPGRLLCFVGQYVRNPVHSNTRFKAYVCTATLCGPFVNEIPLWCTAGIGTGCPCDILPVEGTGTCVP